ncbi:MAG: hypothetical protein K2K37_08670 [Muribaculaceae bacterium]|nr:hypothetical protein [Muribaculaceae bacterium]
MNYNRDIDNVRRLLERYYRAETTPEEEKYMERFFLETDATDIPADMAADRVLFVKLSATFPLPSELEAPDNLLGKIEDIVGEPAAVSSVKKNNIWQWMVRAAVVAGVVCAIVVMARLSDKEMETENLTADASVGYGQDTNVLNIKISENQHEDTGTDISVEQEVRPTIGSTNTIPKRTIAEDDNGFIEITDPAEAQRIALDIGKLLAQNAVATNNAIEEIGETFDNYKEMTKNILQ